MSNKTSDKNVAEDRVIAHKFAVMQQQLEQKEKRIQELEEENTILKKASNIAKDVNIEDVTEIMNKSYEEFMSDYISKQVIIDKIKEYDKKMEEDAGHPNWVITDRIVINVLQELLGGERNELER